MTTRTRRDVIDEVERYISDRVRPDVNTDLLATELVDKAISRHSPGSDFSMEVRGYYTITGNPLPFSIEPPDFDVEDR